MKTLSYKIRSMRIEFRSSGGFGTWLLRKLTRKTVICDVEQHYVRKSDIAFTLKLADDGADGKCCYACLEPVKRFGKFQAYSNDPDSLATALILYSWSMDSSSDDVMGNTDSYGYFERFGNFITCHDSQGFFTYEEFSSVESAEKEWNRYSENGASADEYDAYIEFQWNSGYSVSFNAEHLGNFDTERRARAAVSVEMRKTGYYPSVWIVSDHGNIHSTSVW